MGSCGGGSGGEDMVYIHVNFAFYFFHTIRGIGVGIEVIGQH